MPNVTVVVPADRLPADPSRIEAFLDACTGICTGVLGAALEKVHIAIVPALPQSRGRDASVEVRYRLEPHRTTDVMTRFLDRLDALLREHLGVTARIRCFGYPAEAIHARN